MDDKILSRISELSGEFCNRQLLTELYGIAFPNDKLLGCIKAWIGTLRRPKILDLPDGRINRFLIENYLQQNSLIPAKLGAYQLGMKLESLQQVVGELNYKGHSVVKFFDASEDLIEEKLIRRFHNFFKETSLVVFETHNDGCKALHKAIKNELNIDVDPVYCTTATHLKFSEPDFAYDIDAINGDPIGIRFQVWLDFGKPKNLRPDACSMYLYSKHKELLVKYLMFGNEPDLFKKYFGETK